MYNHDILDPRRIFALQVRKLWRNSPFADPNMKACFKYQILKVQNKKELIKNLIFKIKLQFIVYLNLLLQVRWFVKWWVENSTISSDSNLRQKTIEVKKEMDQDRILMYSRANGTLRRSFVLLDNSYSSFTTRWLNKKKHLTINTVKLNFVKKTIIMLSPVERHLK